MTTTYLINRILSGITRVKVSLVTGDTFLIKRNPTKEVRYIADEIYEESLSEAIRFGLLSQQEMLDRLIKEGKWSIEKEGIIAQLEKDIENLKVGLYETKSMTNHDEFVVRHKIKDAYKQIDNLYSDKHCYDYVTAEGYAGICRARYLTRSSLFTEDGSPEFSPFDTKNLYKIDDLVDKAAEYINDNRIEEADYRRVARSPEWAQIWETADSGVDLFGVPSCDMSIEQLVLYNWSKLYSNIQQSPDKPRKQVIQDDYKLDGWLILERRKANKTEIDNEYNKRVNNKIADSDEVYVIAQKVDEVQEINSLNDVQGKMVKKQRMAALSKKGKMHDFEMPDQQQKIAMLQNQMSAPRG